MKVLITSGGTTEPIDNVRGISNFASGRLGKVTAEHFLKAGHQVFLLAGDKAVLPEPTEQLTHIPIMGTQNLYEQLEKLVPQVDVVIHSMAVSDYRPVYMAGLDQLPETLTKEELLHFRPTFEKKISSSSEHQIMILEKTPKIINFIKKWKPEVTLFGFKLLVGVTEQELIKVAQEKLTVTQADFIIANDLEKINDLDHQALLISSTDIKHLKTKTDIAQEILIQAERIHHD